MKQKKIKPNDSCYVVRQLNPSRIKINILILIFAIAAFAPSVVLGQVSGIWAVNDGEKVDKYDLNNPNKTSNSAWDGKKIKIFGGRNEVISFQLIVEGGSNGTVLNVAFPQLKKVGGGDTITYKAPAADPTDYVDRPISIFTESYMNIAKKTTAGWIMRPNSPSEPAAALGTKPVQLVPENAAAGKGGLPISVNANENQGIWFDIYTAKSLSAGKYTGTVTVIRNGVGTNIPIELDLFDFTLPDENSMDAMIFAWEPLYARYHNIPAADYNDAYQRFAHRQRVDFVEKYDIPFVEKNMDRFDGTLFTSANKYEGPGVGVGNRVIPRSFYPKVYESYPNQDVPPVPGFGNEADAWASADAWMKFLNDNRDKLNKNITTFFYLVDEPWFALSKQRTQWAFDVGGWLRSNPGIGKTLPLFLTSKYADKFKNIVDIWDTSPEGYDSAKAEELRANGGDMWIYNGNRPFTGAAVYDCPATDMRATMWACFKKGIKNYFYYENNVWTVDPWVDPVSFEGIANGDGVLVYPGEDKVTPSEDRNILGPISGITMANLRRGLQDHLYLTMAREKGLDDDVKKCLNAIVPYVMDDLKYLSDDPLNKCSVMFPEDGNSYEAARYILAQALSTISKLK